MDRIRLNAGVGALAAELFFNEYEGHFSLVTDPDAFTHFFSLHAMSASFHQTARQ